MKPSLRALAVALSVFAAAAIASAQQFPLVDMVAEKVVQKVQTASCEDLWKDRQKPKGEREQELINLMHNDAQIREEFFKKVATPLANKMFECGMFP